MFVNLFILFLPDLFFLPYSSLLLHFFFIFSFSFISLSYLILANKSSTCFFRHDDAHLRNLNQHRMRGLLPPSLPCARKQKQYESSTSCHASTNFLPFISGGHGAEQGCPAEEKVRLATPSSRVGPINQRSQVWEGVLNHARCPSDGIDFLQYLLIRQSIVPPSAGGVVGSFQLPLYLLAVINCFPRSARINTLSKKLQL